MVEYAILYFLLFRGFFLTSRTQTPSRKALLYSLVLSVLYAISDEIHQTFVPTREGKIWDVVIDAFGISIMYIYMKKDVFRFKRIV